jgi:hypothetical protein
MNTKPKMTVVGDKMKLGAEQINAIYEYIKAGPTPLAVVGDKMKLGAEQINAIHEYVKAIGK